MPPPPPPPICIPFISRQKRRVSIDEKSDTSHPHAQLTRRPSAYSSSSTLTSLPDNLTFRTDSEKYDEVPPLFTGGEKDSNTPPKLSRGNTMTGTKKSTASSKWGYGWGLGKKEKEVEAHMHQRSASGASSPLPQYQTVEPSLQRSGTKSSQATRSTQSTVRVDEPPRRSDSRRKPSSLERKDTQRSHVSRRSQDSKATTSSRSTAPRIRPPLTASDSASTLVGSALERKERGDVESIHDRSVNTTERLAALREQMLKNNVDVYLIPSEDAHGSEYVAASDKRREFITGFTGTAGAAIITRENAYLAVDSRYWVQAENQTDANWEILRVGDINDPKSYKDWVEFLVTMLPKGSRLGVDARMISHEKASAINSKLTHLDSRFVFPAMNLVDLVWKEKPAKSKGSVYVQSIEYTGKDATYKLYKIREWIKAQPPSIPSFSKATEPTPQQIQAGMLVSNLACIAWTLNLRGVDIPFNPLFHAYLFIGLDKTILFLDASKVDENIERYLEKMGVERRNYTDLWPFMRKREWGDGKIIIPSTTSYAISLMLTHFRYTISPNRVEFLMSIKNETEIAGLRHAYIRDGVAFVQFLAWLENKLNSGYDITEWEAGWRVKEFRMKQRKFMGLAYETISASGPNAALPHYTPKKATAKMIDRDTPYLNDSGGQYRDGTCDTTRTLHFGRPTPHMSEAYTRVVQGHIAIDTAIFPEGTSGYQLDSQARRPLWKDGMNYLHGTGHGFGSFLTVHEGEHGFSSNVPLMPGHVVTNEPGFYVEGKWGVRVESALVVKRVKTKQEFGGDTWLGFERLTCVPIQTRMIKESLLTKEEKSWLKDHNLRCWDILSPLLREDKVALKWLRKEADRGIGLPGSGPGGLTVEWD
ncbi:hypothetical protein AGABI2DRAFT_212532 [Agaricus bisporus var. bisporus H97]|uniref:hypothetical protein n=1 Tax=Agaricus bisporus var. bisporus (strain H97 / ATCC MYA-4626 / FGSC 10389) TaxID=936046 RepID=UPI00029F718B|nr:hypothetical protein AGABI2DRAFT_212532 [Agaricus bisporus var. bisporus H97]EKV41955.1 hypothetical protein AGABI2DRAFT_212532 [Agaricus bisporus var. bisporus H97]